MGALTEGVEHPLPPTASSGKLARHFQDKKQRSQRCACIWTRMGGEEKKMACLEKKKEGKKNM